MSAHLVIQTKEIIDEKMYGEYVSKAGEIIRRRGGRYIIQSDKITPLADWKPARIIVIEFDNVSALKACFNSEEYRQIVHLRENSVIGSAVVVEDGS